MRKATKRIESTYESSESASSVIEEGRDLSGQPAPSPEVGPDVLARYWPSETSAIFSYQKRLQESRGGEVTLVETITQWEDGACYTWRRRKMRADGQRQLQEIERHKYLISQNYGYDVGWEMAASDWIENHANEWRKWWETQSDACPQAF